MKNVFALLFLLPLFCVSQKPTVIGYSRFFPKNDKVLELRTALKNHATKYHTGQWKWRVYSIETGPAAGGYLTIEGPSTWDQIDKRGTLGEEHMKDLYKNVLPLTTEKNEEGFLVFREELSSVALTDYSEKITIAHIFPRSGKFSSIEAQIQLLTKVWKESNQSVAVYEASASGPVQFTIVTRHKDGLKEKEKTYRKPMKERYNAANGEGSFDKYLASIPEDLESQWSEMAFLDPELGSK